MYVCFLYVEFMFNQYNIKHIFNKKFLYSYIKLRICQPKKERPRRILLELRRTDPQADDVLSDLGHPTDGAGDALVWGQV